MNRHCRIGKIKPKNGGAEIRILERPERYNSEVCTFLEEYLDRARQGQIRYIAVALVNHQNGAETDWASDGTGGLNIIRGAVSRLNHRLNED